MRESQLEYCGMYLWTPYYVRTSVPSSAVMTKFYGYYVPVDEKKVKG